MSAGSATTGPDNPDRRGIYRPGTNYALCAAVSMIPNNERRIGVSWYFGLIAVFCRRSEHVSGIKIIIFIGILYRGIFFIGENWIYLRIILWLIMKRCFNNFTMHPILDFTLNMIIKIRFTK